MSETKTLLCREQRLCFVGVSEKSSLRCVVEPRRIQMDFLWRFSEQCGGAEQTTMKNRKTDQDTLQAIAPTHVETVHQTSFLHNESNLDRLLSLTCTSQLHPARPVCTFLRLYPPTESLSNPKSQVAKIDDHRAHQKCPRQYRRAKNKILRLETTAAVTVCKFQWL